MTSSTTATCTNSDFQWSFNSLDQSPCTIVGYLGGVCNAGQFTVQSLLPGNVYLGPTRENTNSCRCSSVFYSLLSACSGCQSRDYLKWSSYNTNCTAVYLGVFPGNIPSGTAVPQYAYLNVSINDSFDPNAALNAGDLPESTAIPRPTSSSASTSVSPPPTSAPTSSPSKAGPIAGGVVGGIVFLALVAALVFWWTRRRRSRTAPSSMINRSPMPPTTTSPMSFNNTVSSSAMPLPRLYDPSDPSTYPSAMPTTPTSGVFSTPEQHILHPNQTYYDARQDRRYHGVPEV